MDEPSIVPAGSSRDAGSQPPRQLRRRAPAPTAAFRPPSPPAAEDQEVEVVPPQPPRRALTRRAQGGKPILTGIDDQSLLLNIELKSSVLTEPPPVDIDAPVRGRSSRLKRRVGTAASQAISISEVDDIKDEPPLKKFKALFEASDPDRVTANGLRSYEGEGSQSLTQTQTQVRGKTVSGAHADGLEVVGEEEEESQSLGSVTRAKRKVGTLEDDGSGNVEMENGQVEPSTKKRAIENMNAVEPSGLTSNNLADARPMRPPSTAKPTKTTKSGAAVGKPDTDAAFLKALASTKRGKRNEDSFDREFNKLKISKPDLGREEQEREWAVLEDFGDDGNIRGNFMVVLEMDVYKEGQSRESDERVEWNTRPNFKKFKKKITPGTRKTVELVVTEENDYGMGSAYWKEGKSQSQSQNNDFASGQTIQSWPKGPTQSQRKANAFVVNDSDEGIDQVIAPRKGKAKAPSRVASQRPDAPQPLFLDSDEEDDEEDDVQTLESHGTRRSTKETGTKKVPAAVVVNDDSDDGATFKGFGTKKKGGRR